MKYKLDCKENFKDSLLFWIARFVKYKLTTLSNKELREPAVLASINANKRRKKYKPARWLSKKS